MVATKLLRNKRGNTLKKSNNLIEKKSNKIKSKLELYDLPSEIISKILSFISTTELFCNVRPVCRRFRELAMNPRLWKTIKVEDNVPTNVLQRWLQTAKYLKSFDATGRTDGNLIAVEISKCCKSLESIKLRNCWGSKQNLLLHSTPICNLVTRCKKLNTINLSQCRFMSCKFFRLISRDFRTPMVRKCNYTGPMNPKQMQALFGALNGMEVHETATIGNVNVATRFRLKDVIKALDTDQSNPNTAEVINDLWENLTLDTNETNENEELMDVDS